MKLDNAQAPDRYWLKADPQAGEADGAAGGDGGAGGGDGGSLLGGGAGDGGAGGANFSIPEKFLVNGADGAPDLKASAAKLFGSYSELEKRVGAHGLPPADAKGYKLEKYLPEGFEVVAENEAKILEGFHSLGLSNKQAQGVMSLYGAQLATGLEQQNTNRETATAALKAEWGDEFSGNLIKAQQYVALLPDAGLKADLLKRGNDPVILKLLALSMDNMGEDKLPAMGGSEAESIDALIASPAYRDEKHADHRNTVAKVNAAYAKGYKHSK